MATSTKSDWLIPAGLIFLSFVPVLAGSIRLNQLLGGAPITPENARFFAAPVPVGLHLVCAILYSLLGAFQFSAGFRRRFPQWHRVAGRILIPAGLIVAVTGLWMTLSYPHAQPLNPPQPVNFDGPGLYVIRLLVGSAMVVFLYLGYAAIRKRKIPQHQNWMMRSYALGLGAGTQVFTHIPWLLFPSIQGELARTLCMGAGWAINLAVVEGLIYRRTRKRRLPQKAQR